MTGLGTTALHLCFGYAAIIHERPAGYSFLPELAACDVEQISIETAQSGLDCSVLSSLDGKTIILGVIDLNDPAVETPDVIVERVRRALPYVPASRLVMAPDCGMKYIPREHGVRQAGRDVRRRCPAARRARRLTGDSREVLVLGLETWQQVDVQVRDPIADCRVHVRSA